MGQLQTSEGSQSKIIPEHTAALLMALEIAGMSQPALHPPESEQLSWEHVEKAEPHTSSHLLAAAASTSGEFRNSLGHNSFPLSPFASPSFTTGDDLILFL